MESGIPDSSSLATAYSPSSLKQKLTTDNYFRLGVSLSTFALIAYLWAFKLVNDIRPIVTIFTIYSLFYCAAFLVSSKGLYQRATDYFVNTCDIVAITLTLYFTGALESPLFPLFAVPFLVQAFHFDLEIILWNSVTSIAGYILLFLVGPHPLTTSHMASTAGQFFFLAIVIVTALIVANRLRRNNRWVKKSFQALEGTVGFLSGLNASILHQSRAAVEQQIVQDVQLILKPMQTYARLWIADESWKVIKGQGEHPAMHPKSAQHIPMNSCPAYALHRPFSYRQGVDKPCPTEQFPYTAHLCLPIMTEKTTYGVLFLGTYNPKGWAPEDLRTFDMLVQAVALTLERKDLFDSLQDKIEDLKFSFEVGSSSLATFTGSTQGIDETTTHILDGVRSILKIDRASLMLWNEEDQFLETRWVRGGNFQVSTPLRLAMGEGAAGWALHTGEPFWAEYATGDPRYIPSAEPIKSLLCVPVFTMDHKPLGVINAVTLTTPRSFNQREINFLKSFGQQAALAIENAHLHQQSRTNIQQLREVDKMKSEFLSLVSHDLRGPLTGMRGFTEILREQSQGPLNSKQVRFLELLESQIVLQERMVDDLLDLARMEKGQLSMRTNKVDLHMLLQGELDRSLPEAEERKIALSLVVSPTDPLPFVNVDEGRIRQVVWNLIHNALKFTPEGGRIDVVALVKGNDVIVEIRDTGIGLSPDIVQKIFDKFFQVSPGGSKGAQGLGLGLAICREIIHAHKGKIWAHSSGLGQGTTIGFTLEITAKASLPTSVRSAA